MFSSRSEVQKIPVKGKFSNLPLLIFLTSCAVIFTALYLLWPQPLFQHTSYGILVFASFALEVRLLKIKGCQICKKLFILSTSIYLFGFLLWNIDNLYCSNLRYSFFILLNCGFIVILLLANMTFNLN